MRKSVLLCCAAGIASVAGCATDSGIVQSRNPYDKVAFTGSTQLYEHDRVAPLERPRQTVGAQKIPLRAVAYGGVEGARDAHATYPRAVAEKLDGRCEKFVKISAGETLASMADLCDVDMAKLVAYNPGVDNPYDIPIGTALKVPGADRLGPVSGIGSLSGELIGLYEIGEGETVNDVAARFDVSLSTMVDMNPEVRWQAPITGDLLRVPANDVATPTGNTNAVKPQWVGYQEGGSLINGRAPTPAPTGSSTNADDLVQSHMPYAQEAVDAPTRTSLATANQGSLTVSSTIVGDKDTLTVTLSGLNSAETVSFYLEGDNAADDLSGTTSASADGVASLSFTIDADHFSLGGFVVRA
ncbi:MAG: LysM domain-containing protein, partial [Pseudomonadota bacterium]